MSDTDMDLLKRYTRDQAEDAFAELVRRHVDLVFSAALRQVRSPQLAEEVAQSAFTDLARIAGKLKPDTIVIAWLYQVTRRTAIDVVRKESRRQLREQIATEMNTMNAPDANWMHIEPLLDEAMSALDETDRAAVLLRYFENKPLREVGATLSISDDAAQKRVSRAVERLREFFVKRGVIVGASGLSAVITANAVQAAPIGLAATLASASLATAAAGAGTTLTFLKIMAMTKTQFGIATLILTGAAVGLLVQHRNENALREQTAVLQQQITRLKGENENLSKQSALTRNVVRLELPAPPMQKSSPSVEPVADWQSTNLLARLQRGEKAPTLTPAQAEKFLDENHHSAASLLAAFRATGDQKLLREAMEKYPDDPRVAFTAAYAPDAPAEERRHWLDVFKQSAPGNSLASYLSALDYFKAGQPDRAVQDLSTAFSQQKFQDYSQDFIQSGEEAYRSAGYSETEARVIPSMSLLLPQFADLKQLNEQMINLAAAYRQAGDESSAQAALQMDATMGKRLEGTANTSLLSQLVGMAIENVALKQMDPNAAYDESGKTVVQRLAELNQRRTALTQFGDQLDAIYSTISNGDWISYHDRWRMYGEENAMRWLLDKYGQK